MALVRMKADMKIGETEYREGSIVQCDESRKAYLIGQKYAEDCGDERPGKPAPVFAVGKPTETEAEKPAVDKIETAAIDEENEVADANPRGRGRFRRA